MKGYSPTFSSNNFLSSAKSFTLLENGPSVYLEIKYEETDRTLGLVQVDFIGISFSEILYTTSGKNHFHEMSGDVGMAGWK